MKRLQLCILTLFLLNLVLSCEKIELPIITDDKEVDHGNSDKIQDGKDSASHEFDSGWRYNCTVDLATGEITDTADVGTGDGTKENPYSAYDFTQGEVCAFLSYGFSSLEDVWVCGYVVGYIQGRSISSSVFDIGNVATNIIIADSPVETNGSYCVPIQLPAHTSAKIRENLNLRDNPSVLGRRVVVCGTATRYMGVFGIKNPKYYVLE